MDKEHPIPQQISSYQFRLVGDMTLKQFFQVAGGTLISLLVYSSSLPGFIKWPVAIASFLFGIALAFFPFGDRPLATWILLFLKSIYSPTIYIWKKSETRRVFFQPEPEEVAVQLPTESIKQPPEVEKLEKKESEFLLRISKILKQVAISSPLHLPKKVPKEKDKKFTTDLEKTLKIREEKSVRIKVEERPSQTIFKQEPPLTTEGFKISPMQGKESKVPISAKFSLEAAPPNPPTKPNIVVGQVLDPNGKIVEGAILEIRDSAGRVVRALKTNKLGHFMIVTPLNSGGYEIITEKEGLIFEPVLLEVKDQIIPPVAIWAKKNNL